MTFHVPSFILGVAAGAGAKAIVPRLRPVVLEVATIVYRVAEALGTQAARRREDLQDLLAEARARVRARRGATDGAASN